MAVLVNLFSIPLKRKRKILADLTSFFKKLTKFSMDLSSMVSVKPKPEGKRKKKLL